MISIDAKKILLEDIEYIGFDDGADYIHFQVKQGVPVGYLVWPPREGWVAYAEDLHGREVFYQILGESPEDNLCSWTQATLDKLQAYSDGATEGAAHAAKIIYGNKFAGW